MGIAKEVVSVATPSQATNVLQERNSHATARGLHPPSRPARPQISGQVFEIMLKNRIPPHHASFTAN